MQDENTPPSGLGHALLTSKAARVAEIQAARGHWRGAANWMDRAAEDHQEIYGLDHAATLIRGTIRNMGN